MPVLKKHRKKDILKNKPIVYSENAVTFAVTAFFLSCFIKIKFSKSRFNKNF